MCGCSEDTEVNSDAVARVERVHVGFPGEVYIISISFESKGDKPFVGYVLLDSDFLDVRFIRDIAVVSDRNMTDFVEPECCAPATRVCEFEARLRIRHTLELSW